MPLLRRRLQEICVESLVGTVFEMRLSRRESVGNIKLRLQRLEGIPRQHMHLLHRGKSPLQVEIWSEIRP